MILLLQILTVEQGATAGVHSYPQMFTVEGFFQMLGVQEGAPSKEELAAAAVYDSMTADWEALEDYLISITPLTALHHIPLRRLCIEQQNLSHMIPLLQRELAMQ